MFFLLKLNIKLGLGPGLRFSRLIFLLFHPKTGLDFLKPRFCWTNVLFKGLRLQIEVVAGHEGCDAHRLQIRRAKVIFDALIISEIWISKFSDANIRRHWKGTASTMPTNSTTCVTLTPPPPANLSSSSCLWSVFFFAKIIIKYISESKIKDPKHIEENRGKEGEGDLNNKGFQANSRSLKILKST